MHNDMRELITITEDARLDELMGRGQVQATVDRHDKVDFERMTGLKAFERHLTGRGFAACGFGSFGSVFSHPGLDYVIKLFKNDPMYLEYVKYSLSHQSNPHVPKFRGKFAKVGDQHFAVRMERLDALSDPRMAAFLAEFNQKARRGWHTGQSILGDIEKTGNAMLINELRSAQPLFLPLLTELLSEFGSRNFDCHEGNVMQRGGIYVITDPVAPSVF